MTQSKYDIKLFPPELKSQVIELQQYLWGDDLAANTAYFEWKYMNNPYTESPLGIVALYKGQVVAFRGYLALRFRTSTENDIIILCSGDICVHPDHRLKGLSLAMGDTAKQEFAEKYKIFMNLSCTRASLPGYIRNGFLPLTNKVYLTHSSPLGLTKYILTTRKSFPLTSSRVTFGRFDRIQVSDRPEPAKMYALISAQKKAAGKITLYQDEKFFQWRFNNQRHKYVFYYLEEDDHLQSYVVLGISPNNRRGYILDYAEKEEGAFKEILRYIIQTRNFYLLSIYNYCLDENFTETLTELGFSGDSLVRILEEKRDGEQPLLFRPIKAKYKKSDLFFAGIDMRSIENWSLKPICSDAV